MSTTFKDAKTTIKSSLDAITSPYSLTFKAEPPDPKTVTEWPAPFLTSEDENAEDSSPRKIIPNRVLGRLTAVVYTKYQADSDPDDDLNDIAQSIKDAMHDLSITAPGFTVRVQSVRYAYNMEHHWGAVICVLEVGAYDWFE